MRCFTGFCQFSQNIFLKEIGMYCVDEHGNPVDAYNHAMDELRYSINHFVKQYMY